MAGACQSHFEALLHAGANFASSPGRIMIHALDPVYVAVRSAFTPFRETINMADVSPIRQRRQRRWRHRNDGQIPDGRAELDRIRKNVNIM